MSTREAFRMMTADVKRPLNELVGAKVVLLERGRRDITVAGGEFEPRIHESARAQERTANGAVN